MRKLIIKFFVLDYVIKIWKDTYTSIPRASFIIMPLMIANGIYSLKVFPVYETVFGIILLGLLIISLFISFVYLMFFPAKWKELSYSQKKQAGNGIVSGFIDDKLTPEERKEMIQILNDKK